MSPKTALAFLAALMVMSLAASAARATQVFHVPVETMAREADLVIHARVAGQRVEWDKKTGRLLTFTDIEVIDPLKGAAAGDALTIYQVGGSKDGVTTHVPGALRFQHGEEMLFFAMRWNGMLVSYGMGLGKYAVYERDGKRWAGPAYGNVAWVQRGPKGWEPTQPPPDEEQELAAFKARLAKVIGSTR